MAVTNQRILVLGGTSGIGLAVARAAVDEGAEVVVVSHQASRLNAALSHLGDRASGHVVDLSHEAAIAEFMATIGDFDHLVYTAGDNILQGALETTGLEEARAFFNVRFWGAAAAVKYAKPRIRPGGSIVLTSSTLPRRPMAGLAIGAAVVAAVEGLAVSLAVELAPIRVNVVSPGVVRTPIWERVPEEYRENFLAAHAATLPVGRIGEAAEVALAYLFLMKATYTTGQVVVVDGGRQIA